MKNKSIFRILMLLILTLSLVGCGNNNEETNNKENNNKENVIAVDECFTVTVDGYSGHATAELKVDYDKFNTLIPQEKIDECIEQLKMGVDLDKENYILSDMFNITFSPESHNIIAEKGVKNGDILTVVIEKNDSFLAKDIQEILDFEFEKMEYQIRVDGLETCKQIDVLSIAKKYAKFFKRYDSEEQIERVGGFIQFPENFEKTIDDVKLMKGSKDDEIYVYYNDGYIGGFSFYFDSVGEGELNSGEEIEICVRSDINYDISDKGYELSAYNLTIKIPELPDMVYTEAEITEQLHEELKPSFDAYISTYYSGKKIIKEMYQWGKAIDVSGYEYTGFFRIYEIEDVEVLIGVFAGPVSTIVNADGTVDSYMIFDIRSNPVNMGNNN